MLSRLSVLLPDVWRMLLRGRMLKTRLTKH